MIFYVQKKRVMELQTHIQIAERLNYIKENQNRKVLDKTVKIGRMLNGLRKSIEKKI
jgi:four helix bundle protein